VLALSGDVDGARRSLDVAMPGSGARMAPFLAKLPSLRSDQKAAAVNLGLFPDSGQPNYAPAYSPTYAYVPQPGAGPGPASPTAPAQSGYAALSTFPSPPARSRPTANVTGAMPMSGGSLASIDQLFGSQQSADRPVEVASITPNMRAQAQQAVQIAARPRVWVQLASGTDPAALPGQFRRLKSRRCSRGWAAMSPRRRTARGC
jgi:hypothetical protein